MVSRCRAGVEVVDREDSEDNSCQVIASRNLIDDWPDYFGKGFECKISHDINQAYKVD